MLKYPWTEKWSSRNKLIASFIEDNKSVLDIGGGLCELKTYIKPMEYKSIDIQKWTDDTIVSNLNKSLPFVRPHHALLWNYIICQGVIEYIEDPVLLLRGLHMYGSTLILTYRKGIIKDMRVNAYTHNEIKILLILSGWNLIAMHDSVSKLEKIYICSGLNKN